MTQEQRACATDEALPIDNGIAGINAKFQRLNPFEQKIILAGIDGLENNAMPGAEICARIVDMAQRHRNGETITEAEIKALKGGAQ